MSVAGVLPLHDVQGNVLHGYGLEHAGFVGVHADTAEALRQCLADLVDRVTSGVHWRGAEPPSTLNAALSFAGLVRLGLPAALLDRFPVAFQEGAARRARSLGDRGRSDPDCWEAGLQTEATHLLLTLHARTRDGRDAGLAALLGRLGAGLTVVHCQEADALAGAREHFGYADGFAQPDVEGIVPWTSKRASRTRGAGVPLDGDRWRPLRLGEFLLGHRDEDDQVVTAPHPLLVRNGTYVVYRKLYQDVAVFRQRLAEAAAATGLHPEVVAAKLMGRWRDGVPLELAPTRADLDALATRADVDPPNDFRYRPHDADGCRCPLGAHVRRVNPRDGLGPEGRLTVRHRLLRRGMPYGDPLPEDGEAEDQDRGLVFVCCNADLERQFELVQRQWCDDGDAFGLGDARDPFVGGPGGSPLTTIPVEGGCPVFVERSPDLVVTRGAEYLFAPGIGALRRLAAGVVWH